MSGFPTPGIALKHLFPLLQEPRIADVALFGLVQFLFTLGGCHGQGAARAGRFRGSMTGGTANKGAGRKRRHGGISDVGEACSPNALRGARTLVTAPKVERR